MSAASRLLGTECFRGSKGRSGVHSLHCTCCAASSQSSAVAHRSTCSPKVRLWVQLLARNRHQQRRRQLRRLPHDLLRQCWPLQAHSHRGRQQSQAGWERWARQRGARRRRAHFTAAPRLDAHRRLGGGHSQGQCACKAGAQRGDGWRVLTGVTVCMTLTAASWVLPDRSSPHAAPVDPPRSAPLSFSAARALPAVVNSMKAILAACCDSPSRRILDTGPAVERGCGQQQALFECVGSRRPCKRETLRLPKCNKQLHL